MSRMKEYYLNNIPSHLDIENKVHCKKVNKVHAKPLTLKDK